MTDARIDSHRLNDIQAKDYTAMRDEAFFDLALWSNPAWLDCSRNFLPAAAATQWVTYHRTSMDMRKVTVAQLIGSVRGVIPNSKLAKYGDYSYNNDYEDMYLTPEDVTLRCNKNDENTDSSDANQGHGYDRIYHEEKRWLKKVKNALEGVRSITNESELLDPRLNELLKLCLRFTNVASINDSLIDILKSEIAFVTDYGQLQKMPISRLELQSIPQPTHETSSSLDQGAVDHLWLTLSSMEVRKCWSSTETKTASFPLNTGSAFSNPLTSLMNINFLRHQPNRQRSDTPTIDIPKKVQRRLLGSLLDIIEEALPLPEMPNDADDRSQRIKFPEAHGEWTKRLFPRCSETNSLPKEQISSAQRLMNAGITSNLTTATLEGGGRRENLAMAMRFYKSVPPPILKPPTWNLPLPPAAQILPPPYDAYRPLTQKGTMWTQTCNNMAVIHPAVQQVQFKIPPVPVAYNPPSVPSPKWNNCFLQRLKSASTIKTAATGQYPRITLSRLSQQHSSKDITEVQKCFLKPEEININFGNKSQQCEELLKKDKLSHVSTESRVSNDNPWLKNKPLVQVQPIHYESNSTVRAHENRGDLFRNCNNSFQTLKCDKYIQYTAANHFNIKSNVQLQLHEPVIPVKINPLMNYRLSPQVNQHAFSPRMTQLTLKPRCMGTNTISVIKQTPERAIFERYKPNEIQKTLYQGNQKSIYVGENLPFIEKQQSLSYEYKVEKWLQTVNKYMNIDSNASFIETSQLENSNSGDKSEVFKGETGQLGKWHNKHPTHSVLQTEPSGTKLPHKIYNLNGNSVRNLMKYKKRSARELILKHLQLFKRSATKLKKGSDLESKIKLLKKYSAEINLNDNCKLQSRCGIKKLKLKSISKDKSATESRRRTISGISQINRKEFKMDTENFFDTFGGISLANNFKVLIHESPEFNAFPSKHTKVINSLFSHTQDEHTKRVASLKYYDKVIDELFFSMNESGNRNEPQDKSGNLEVINGWTHLKITVKCVLKNIITSFDRRISWR